MNEVDNYIPDKTSEGALNHNHKSQIVTEGDVTDSNKSINYPSQHHKSQTISEGVKTNSNKSINYPHDPGITDHRSKGAEQDHTWSDLTLNGDSYVAEANGRELVLGSENDSDATDMNTRMQHIQQHAGISAIKASQTLTWAKATEQYGKDARDAINKEVNQIITICEPTRLWPEDHHRCHDLFDIKHDGKKKARLVAGKTVHGSIFDYGVSLYSPTIDMKLIFIMLSICVQLGHELEVWDVKGAFLQSPMLTENIHVRINKHLVKYFLHLKPEWREYLLKDGSLMVVVKNAWYGLSAASSLWNIEITNSLKECGYSQHHMVPCLFYKFIHGQYCYIMLHVDDMGVIMPTDGIEKRHVKFVLEKKYGTLDTQSGDRVRYIGIELFRNRTCPIGDRFEMSMRTRLVELAETLDVKEHIATKDKVKNPAMNKHFSESTLEEDNDKHEDITGYRSLVMTIMYISMVYPMVKYHVNFLSTKQSSPSKMEWKKAVHILQYLVDLGEHPMYIYGMGKGILYLYVFTDASFSMHLDSKSQSGISIFFGEAGCSVYSSSAKQHSTAGSSTGAEAIAAETGVYMGNYFREVLEVLGYNTNVIQLQDNEACVTLVKTGCRSYDKKLKHTVRKLNFMHEYFEDANNRSVLLWVRTVQMLADIMTKDLWHQLFTFMSDHMTGRTRSLFPDESP
jgi:hypothetical protein